MHGIKNFLKGNIYLILAYRVLILYALYSICRLLFFGYNYSHFSDLGSRELMKIFTGGLLFDSSAIVYTNLLYFALYLLPFKFRHYKYFQGVLMILFFLTNGLALIANIADVAYYEYVLQRTTMDIFDQFKNEENMGTLIFRFIFEYWYLTLLWIILMILLVFLYLRFKVGSPRIKSGLVYFFSGLLMFAFCSLLIVGGARGGFKQFVQPITLNNSWYYVKNPDDAAIVLNTPFTLLHTFKKHGYQRVNYFPSGNELENIYVPFHKGKNNPVRQENVVIFIIESLNKEFIGSLNKNLDDRTYKGCTPFLDSLIGVSKVYRHSYANGRKSIDILPSLFCSIPRMGIPFVLMTPYYRNKLNSLPGLMKEMGYKSAFFHGAPNGSFGFESFTNIIGVDEYYGINEYTGTDKNKNKNDFDGTWGIWDEEYMQYFANTIDTFATPFIATLFSLSSHHPFALPAKYKNRFTNSDFPLERCIQYTDYSLKRFFETVSAMSWFNNTLFIITADHVSVDQRPEFRNETGYFSVPIIFYKPGSDMIGTDTITNAQQIDIMPTLLNYLGYNREYIAFGKDIFNNDEKNFAFNFLNDSYRLFLDDKLIVSDGKETRGFYKIEANGKPVDCRKDLNQASLAEMELFLKAYIQQYVNRMIDDRLTEK